MPAEAFDALKAERRRRTWTRRVGEMPVFGVLMVLAASGALIAWFLLVR